MHLLTNIPPPLLPTTINSEAIVNLAFDTTKHIFNNFRGIFWDTAFVDGVNALVEFATNAESHTINMEVRLSLPLGEMSCKA